MENSTFDLMYKVCNCGVHMYRHSGRVAQPHHIAVDEIDLSLPATLEVLEHRGFDIPVEGNYCFNPRLIAFLYRDIARPARRNWVHSQALRPSAGCKCHRQRLLVRPSEDFLSCRCFHVLAHGLRTNRAKGCNGAVDQQLRPDGTGDVRRCLDLNRSTQRARNPIDALTDTTGKFAYHQMPGILLFVDTGYNHRGAKI